MFMVSHIPLPVSVRIDLHVPIWDSGKLEKP